MPAYKDVDGDSGIVWFDTGPDWIDLEWERGKFIYRYSYASAGATHVEQMKRLAAKGNGLNTYLNKHAAQKYASKRPTRSAR